MKNKDHSKLLSKIEKCRAYVREGHAYAAAESLAEIHCNISGLKGDARSCWDEEIRHTVFTPAEHRKIDETLVARCRRIERILSVGEEWQWEEFILILTLRTEVEIVRSLMATYYEWRTEINLRDIDEQMREIAKSKQNSSTFRSALQRLDRKDPLLRRLEFSRILVEICNLP